MVCMGLSVRRALVGQGPSPTPYPTDTVWILDDGQAAPVRLPGGRRPAAPGDRALGVARLALLRIPACLTTSSGGDNIETYRSVIRLLPALLAGGTPMSGQRHWSTPDAGAA